MSDDVELSAAEREALAAARRDLPPPADAEARTIAALRARGMLRGPASAWLRRAAAAAVLLAAFGAGALWQRASSRGEVASGPRYMLLLYGGEAAGGADRRSEYAAWARGVASDGIGISGEELADRSEEVQEPARGDALPEAARPRGYFIVTAVNLDEARKIAATCPHVRYGGRIVIRPIVAGS